MTKRQTTFKLRHEIEFGLKVVSRNPETKEIESVRCNFCVQYGKESLNSATRKRKATENVKYFKYPFRVDNYRSHLRQHSTRWDEYKKLSYEDKRTYFDHLEEPKPEKCTINVDISQRKDSIFIVNGTIVEDIIGDLMFDENSEDEVTTKHEALSIFELCNDTHFYSIHLSNKYLFEACRNAIARGASIRLATRLFGSKGLTFTKVTSYVRLSMALSYQALSDLMKASWTYSISFIGSNISSISYLDIRLRLYVKDDIHDYHLLSLPMFERHNGEFMFDILCKLLDVLDSDWKSKLVGVTTDGSINMTGCHRGVATRLQEVTIPGFYGVWNGMHQLDVIIQSCVNDFFNDILFGQMILLIGYLRQQQTGIPHFKMKASEGNNVNWMNLSEITTWLLSNRIEIQNLLIKQQPQCIPSRQWWIYIAILDAACLELKKYFEIGKGLSCLISQQSKTLESLQHNLMFLVDARHQLISFNFDSKNSPSVAVKGEYFVNEIGCKNMIKDCGPFFQDIYTKLSSEEQRNTWHDIAQFMLNVIHGISNIKCSNDGPNPYKLPCVLPHQLIKLRTHEFMQLLNQHTGRYTLFRTAEDKQQLEEEYRDFKTAFRDESTFQTILQTHTDQFSFKQAWNSTNERFYRLREFCGGLATAYPNTKKMEFDETMMNYGKNSNKEIIIDLTMEGILHCQQLPSLIKTI